MPTKILYVRIKPKSGVERFFRCGIPFSRAWQKLVDLDAATAQRLEEEQMLETSETKPDDYVDPEATTSKTIPVVPTDPALRAAAIKAAIAKLEIDDAALWTGTGMPKVPAIAAVTGWDVTQQERDAVWADLKAAQ